MNSVHLTLAAGILIPGAIATGMAVMPSDADRRDALAQSEQQAAIQRKVNEEDPQRFVLQPFYVPGGAFIFNVEAKGAKGLSALCGNLPVVHDAIISQLDQDSRLFASPSDKQYKPDGEQFRRAINVGFTQPHVLQIDISYYADTDVSLAGKRKVGSATRCLSLK